MDASTATARSEPSLPEVGDVVGDRFEILAVLGEGGMGHVYRARDRDRGQEVTLKLLIARYLGRAEREARLFREAELLERAGHHPSLVELLEAGRLGPLGWPYLVMRVVEGESLWAHVAFRGGLTPNTAMRIARQVAAAVAALHRVGVVHRDVTPTNVLIEGNHAVLIDLSHAGDVGRTGRLTGPHEVPGTHPYMSREQACAEPAHPAMDVYAFGVTLVQMLTGVMVEGLPREAFITLARQGMVEAPTVDPRVFPDFPSGLAELIAECTQMDAAMRPGMEEVVARLDGLLLEMQPVRRAPRKVYPVGGVPAQAEVRPTVVDGDARESAETVANDESEEPGAGSRRRIAVVIGVVVVAIVGVLWLLLGHPEPVEESGAEVGSPERERAVAADGGAQAPSKPVPVEPQPGVVQGSTDDGADPEEQPEAHPPEPEPIPTEPETPRPKRPGKTTAPCVDPEPAAAKALVAKSWNEVLELTAKPRCWSSADLRWSYRAMALYGLGRHEQCLSAASKSSSRNAQRAAAMCREAQKAKEADP